MTDLCCEILVIRFPGFLLICASQNFRKPPISCQLPMKFCLDMQNQGAPRTAMPTNTDPVPIETFERITSRDGCFLLRRASQKTLSFITIWEFGERVDSTRGVAAIVAICRNTSCNSSCDAIARSGRKTMALFLLFQVQ